MNNQQVEQILTGTNKNYGTQFDWGYHPISEFSYDQLYLNRASLDVIEVERASTLLLGELIGLKIDEEIFRGNIPMHVNEGFEVSILSEFQEPNFEYRTFEIACSGRKTDRDAILKSISILTGKLPLPTWITINYAFMTKKITFITIYQIGEAQYSTINYDGKVIYSGSVNLFFLVSTCH